jgi:hypothetical protein
VYFAVGRWVGRRRLQEGRKEDVKVSGAYRMHSGGKEVLGKDVVGVLGCSLPAPGPVLAGGNSACQCR